MDEHPRAIIADDEQQLREFLHRRLQEVWPELNIVGFAKNGLEAVALIEEHHPDIAFLDIKMPGLSGIEVAAETMGKCQVVFVTSYDDYAIEAFEREAIDYLLKPVSQGRLKKTVHRLQKGLTSSVNSTENLPQIISELMSRLPGPTQKHLQWIKVHRGETIHLISVDDIYAFKASDKYTVVYTAAGEALINTTISTLVQDLDSDKFWQVHRSTIVNVFHISKISRSLTGRFQVHTGNVAEPFTVSRTYSHLFKQM